MSFPPCSCSSCKAKEELPCQRKDKQDLCATYLCNTKLGLPHTHTLVFSGSHETMLSSLYSKTSKLAQSREERDLESHPAAGKRHDVALQGPQARSAGNVPLTKHSITAENSNFSR